MDEDVRSFSSMFWIINSMVILLFPIDQSAIVTTMYHFGAWICFFFMGVFVFGGTVVSLIGSKELGIENDSWEWFHRIITLTGFGFVIVFW